MAYKGRVSWVGSVPHRSCTRFHNGELGLDRDISVDNLSVDDAPVDDISVDDVSVDDLSDLSIRGVRVCVLSGPAIPVQRRPTVNQPAS